MQLAPHQSLAAIRIVVGVLLAIHGIARVYLGGVAPFGEWLGGQGFPAGLALAAIITGIELVAAPILAAGRLVRPIAFYFSFQLTMGILLLHGREGWFVVGAGRNGMEYSVALIGCLLAVGLASPGLRK